MVVINNCWVNNFKPMGIPFPFENVTEYWFNYCAAKPSRPNSMM